MTTTEIRPGYQRLLSAVQKRMAKAAEYPYAIIRTAESIWYGRENVVERCSRIVAGEDVATVLRDSHLLHDVAFLSREVDGTKECGHLSFILKEYMRSMHPNPVDILQLRDKEGRTPLHCIVIEDDVCGLNMMLELCGEGMPSPILDVTDKGDTLLHECTGTGNVDCMKVLVARWPEDCVKACLRFNNERETPMQQIAQLGNGVPCLKLLLEVEPDILMITAACTSQYNGGIHVHCASAGDGYGYKPTVLDFILSNCPCTTLVAMGEESERTDRIKRYVAEQVDIDVKEIELPVCFAMAITSTYYLYDVTPLHSTIRNNTVSAARSLLSHVKASAVGGVGVKELLSIRAASGKTAYELALSYEDKDRTEMLELLRPGV